MSNLITIKFARFCPSTRAVYCPPNGRHPHHPHHPHPQPLGRRRARPPPRRAAHFFRRRLPLPPHHLVAAPARPDRARLPHRQPIVCIGLSRRRRLHRRGA